MVQGGEKLSVVLDPTHSVPPHSIPQPIQQNHPRGWSLIRKNSDPFIVTDTTLLAGAASLNKAKEVLRLKGGAKPPKGPCCNQGCILTVKSTCQTCDHFVCFVDVSKVNGLKVCEHCQDLRQSVSEAMDNDEDDGEDIDIDEVTEDVPGDNMEEEEFEDDWIEIEDVEEFIENMTEEETTQTNDADFRCCEINFKSRIPHLRKNDKCRELYVNKYEKQLVKKFGEKLKEVDIETLLSAIQSILKVEDQFNKRKQKDYRDKMYQKRNVANKKKKIDDLNSAKEFLDNVETILSLKCEICKSYFSTNHVEHMDEKTDYYKELVTKGAVDKTEEVLICKWCKEVLDSIERWKEFGEEDDEIAKEYKDWARDNFNVEDKVNELKRVFSEKSSHVGIKIFNDENNRHIVLFPVVNPDGFQMDVEDKQEGYKNIDPTVLLPQEFLNEDPNETLSRPESELANRTYNQNLTNLLSVLILDRLGMMDARKNRRIARNSEVMRGIAKENKLNLTEINSLDGCLVDLKGSAEFLKKLQEDMLFCQLQNGTTNLTINWVVFQGFSQVLEDPLLAMTLLRLKGYKIKYMGKLDKDGIPVRDYRVCCGPQCDPFECRLNRHHQSPLDLMNDIKPDIDLLAIVRFMHSKVEALINKVIKPRAANFSLFLSFDRPTQEGSSGFVLSGHIWLDDLTPYNTSSKDIPDDVDVVPKAFKAEYLKKLLGDGDYKTEVMQEILKWHKNCYSEEKDITEPTNRNLDLDDKHMCRETSIFEALYCCGRNMSMSWRSQATVYINTNDPRKLWKTFKRAENENENEKHYFNAPTGAFWVEDESNNKDYNNRPFKAEPLVLLQMVQQFRTLDKANANYEAKVEELERNGGIEEDTEILGKTLKPLKKQ